MIRPATVNDVSAMTSCALRMFNESPHYSQFSIDVQKVYDTISWQVASDRGIALVYEIDGQVVGGFIGEVDVHWFGNHLHGYDYGLFIDKKHRGGMTAASLINAAVQVARDKGASEFVIANTTGVNSERVESLYQACGFQRLGGTYSKTLN